MDHRAKAFLESYLATLSHEERKEVPYVTAEHFCAEEREADLCAELVRKGTKVATCSMKYWYESGECQMPAIGNLMVVLNWAGEPTSIISTLGVSESRFCDVDEEHAHAEGEGDLSLAWWRRAHWEFFTRECEEAGIDPSEEMVLVLERFERVY